MRLLMHGKNLKVTDALQEYVERKMARLEKWSADDADLHITMLVQGHPQLHKVELSLHFKGSVIRAEETTADMYESIDRVMDKLTNRLKRWSGKLQLRSRDGAKGRLQEGKDSTEESAKSEGPENLDVARVKFVDLKPENLEEAILQMNLLDHSFHMFTNAETQLTEVVYKRNDGTYGLIKNAI